MDEDSDKALGFLRNFRMKVNTCRESLIDAQRDFKQALLHMETISDRTDLNTVKLDKELDKMKPSVEGLNASAAEINNLYFKEALSLTVNRRPGKCRKGEKLINDLFHVT